jgi:hypothetical protein
LIDGLLLGAKPRSLERVLRKQGLSAARARREVDAVVGDPSFRGAFRAIALHRKIEGLMQAYSDLYRQGPAHEQVERRDAVGAPELLQRYVLKGRPVIVRGPPSALAGALPLEAPERWPAGARASPLRQAATDLVVHQRSGSRELALVPWSDVLSVAGRARAAAAKAPPLELEVALAAGECLFIPAGWWYRRKAGATGVTACHRAGEAAAGAIHATPVPRQPASGAH